MDERTQKGRGALMKHHQSLRSLLIMQNILPALCPLLTGVEYSRIDGKEDNVAQVDEFIRILLTKEFMHFETFCTVLASNGYEHWAKRLREEVSSEAAVQGSPLPMARLVSGPSTQLSMSPKKQDCALPVALMKGGARCSSVVKLPPMPIELQVISSALLNDKIYISGVATEKEEGSLQVQVYSLSESERSKLPEAPTHTAPIADVNGRITMIGGREGIVNKSNPTKILSTWCQEESKGEWMRTLTSMPSARVGSGVCYYDNLFLVSGGFEESRWGKEEYQVVDTVFVYNFSTQRWSAPQDLQLPIALRSHYLVLCGQYVYLVGGAYIYPIYGNAKEPFNSKAWRVKWTYVLEAVKRNSTEPQAKYDRSVWTPIAGPPGVRSTVVSCNNSLLSVGGISNGLPHSAIYKLVNENSNNPCWIEVGSMSVGRYRHAVVPLGNLGAALFVAGGIVREGREADEMDVISVSAEMVLL